MGNKSDSRELFKDWNHQKIYHTLTKKWSIFRQYEWICILFSRKLRNGSNSTGTDFSIGGYGAGDIVKVQFNSKTGTLSFGKNKGQLEKAFEK